MFYEVSLEVLSPIVCESSFLTMIGNVVKSHPEQTYLVCFNEGKANTWKLGI